MRTERSRSSVPGKTRARLSAALTAAVFVTSVAAQRGWVAERRGPAGKDLNTVFFANERRGWVGGDAGLVLRTEDGGRTWSRQQTGVGESVNDLYFRDKEEGYLLAGNKILLTEDGGATWRTAHEFSPRDFGGAVPELYSVRFGTKKKGWVVGSISRGDRVVDALLLHTEDGGASWVRRAVPVRDELIHLDFDGEKRGWIVGDHGTILHTVDGGATWARQRSPTTATLYHVDFAGGKNGWAVGERSTVIRTTDGGETWAQANAPAAGQRSTLLSVAFANDEEGWAVGRGGLILRSSDGGRTWLRQESGTTENLYALFVNKKNGWAVGGDGMVLQYDR